MTATQAHESAMEVDIGFSEAWMDGGPRCGDPAVNHPGGHLSGRDTAGGNDDDDDDECGSNHAARLAGRRRSVWRIGLRVIEIRL